MLSRRSFLDALGFGSLALARGTAQNRFTTQRRVAEFSFTSGKAYRDPFNEVQLDVVFTDPKGKHYRVPAFWAGDGVWRVRYSAEIPGVHHYRTVSSDTENSDLEGRTGQLVVEPYQGDNPLYRRGPLQVSENRRYLEHADGTPFFWLGDTWWMGLCHRLKWPEGFQELVADRVRKGFSVIQIVAGLYPDMPEFDPRGANEAGYPWDDKFTAIRPSYFDMADIRIQYLIERGLTPCIVGCWGYFLPIMGVERMKQHWRNLIARWGAYPVVWCLAGEGSMPYYLSETKEKDKAMQESGWSELGRYVRQTDPFHRLLTIHPSGSSRVTVDDPSVLDFDMLQTGHGDRESIPNTIQLVTASYAAEPVMPVLNSEVCYEGILEHCREEMQRFMFWSCVLSGAFGHTYGANGIWQVNTAEKPFGRSPHGRSWGDTPWDVAYKLPGSLHLSRGKALLMRYPWWRFQPHPEWVEPRWSEKDYMMPYAAGIPREVRFIYFPAMWNPPKVTQLNDGARYRALLFDPSSGKEHELGEVKPDSNGEWQLPIPPVVRDWVLVLDTRG